MDKYEQRQLRLIEIRDRSCNGKTSKLAYQTEKEPSYASKMLCPEGRSGKKRIASDMMELIGKSLSLPRGWTDILTDGKAGATDHPEFAGNIRASFVPVVDEVVLGADGSVDMTELRSDWLSIYSGDRGVYGSKVKGDSMWPGIQSEEYVVTEPNTPVHPDDEVSVRTKDGHNMTKITSEIRDSDCQLSSINSDHRPITLPVEEVDKIHFAPAIVKHTRYID